MNIHRSHLLRRRRPRGRGRGRGLRHLVVLVRHCDARGLAARTRSDVRIQGRWTGAPSDIANDDGNCCSDSGIYDGRCSDVNGIGICRDIDIDMDISTRDAVDRWLLVFDVWQVLGGGWYNGDTFICVCRDTGTDMSISTRGWREACLRASLGSWLAGWQDQHG